MRALLDEHFAPTTSTIGFLNTSVTSAVRAYRDWMEPNLRPVRGRYIEETVTGDLSDVLARLPPLCTPVPMKFLFVPTAADWTAFFDNGKSGTYAVGPVCLLAGRIGCRGVSVTSVPNTKIRGSEHGTKGRYGANMLEVFRPDGSHLRTISSANDGGKWRFDQIGAPFEFEDASYYGRRAVKDRFTNELLQEYARRLGLDIFDEHFYASNSGEHAILLTRNDATPNSPINYREYLLADVQRDLGLR